MPRRCQALDIVGVMADVSSTPAVGEGREATLQTRRTGPGAHRTWAGDGLSRARACVCDPPPPPQRWGRPLVDVRVAQPFVAL